MGRRQMKSRPENAQQLAFITRLLCARVFPTCHDSLLLEIHQAGPEMIAVQHGHDIRMRRRACHFQNRR